MENSVLIRDVRFIDDHEHVDVLVLDGRVAAITPEGTGIAQDTNGNTIRVIDGDGRVVLPGFWDCHTHFTQWACTFGCLDLLAAHSASDAMLMLHAYLDILRENNELDPNHVVIGMQFRHSLWADDEQPSLALINQVTGNQPVVLSSADMHCGWVNSAAAAKLNVQVDASGLVGEREWFRLYKCFDTDPVSLNQTNDLVRKAQADAARKGVVGVRDYEMAPNISTWIDRFAQGIDGLRIDAGVYPERMEEAIDEGWHTGDELPGSHGLGHVGAMKLISDGSLNTRSAFCSTAYSGMVDKNSFGKMSYSPEEIEYYLQLATDHGFDVACHAIGDEANTIVLDAVEKTQAHGSIEHAQMLKDSDIPRFAKLGLTASIQPQHAMDDRDVISRFWEHPAGKPYAFKDLRDYGVPLSMGSDAPVAPLDPWLAISAAVFGTESSDQEAFQPDELLDVRTALAASTAVNRVRIRVGDVADIIMVDEDPVAIDSPEAMQGMAKQVRLTLLEGRQTWNNLSRD